MIMTTLASIDIFILLLIRYFEKQDQKHPTQYIHIKFYHILRSSSSSSAIFYIQGWKQLFEGGSSSVSNRCPHHPFPRELSCTLILQSFFSPREKNEKNYFTRNLWDRPEFQVCLVRFNYPGCSWPRPFLLFLVYHANNVYSISCK